MADDNTTTPPTPPGASLVDIGTILNQVARNGGLANLNLSHISTSVATFAAALNTFSLQAVTPGFSLSTAVSPKATINSSITSTVSIQVIGSSSTRRHIEFYGSVDSNGILYLMPGNLSAIVGFGVPLTKTGSYIPQTFLNINCAWNCISDATTTGDAITIMEFF